MNFRGKRRVEILVTQLLAPFATRGANKYTSSIARVFIVVYIRIWSRMRPITYSKEPVGGLRNLPTQELGLHPLLGPAGAQKGRQGQQRRGGPVFHG